MSNDRLRRQHRFTVTPEHLILDPRVSDRAFRLWCRLDRYAGQDDSAFPARESLAIELDTSPSSIDRATKELVAAGWLEKERRAAGDSCIYTLIVAPEKEVERLVEAARKARKAATEPRREKARERRRQAKSRSSVKGSQDEVNAEVNAGGVVTGDETPADRGVVTHDNTPVVTGDERGVVTGDEQKEATTQGSIIEGDSDSSLRSEPGAAGGDSGALFETTSPASSDDDPLTDQERETGRDTNGQPLKGKRLTALAQDVAKSWWDWITENDHEKPAQSFIACRGVIRAALGNGIEPRKIKLALVKITKEGRAVSGASLTIAMQSQEQQAATPRRGDIDWSLAEDRARQMSQMLTGGASA